MNTYEVQSWLDRFGAAWIGRDPELIGELFSDSAAYFETPFSPPLLGKSAIRRYWEGSLANARLFAHFSAQIWAITSPIVIAGWQAGAPSGRPTGQAAIDGVFRLGFSRHASGLICESLDMWWHHQEI